MNLSRVYLAVFLTFSLTLCGTASAELLTGQAEQTRQNPTDDVADMNEPAPVVSENSVPAAPAHIFIVEDTLARVLKPHFMQIYDQVWRNRNMSKFLNGAVNESFSTHTDEMWWGTRGYLLATNDSKIIDRIQDDVESMYYNMYKDFIAEIDQRWEQQLRTDILEFYKKELANTMISTNKEKHQLLKEKYAGMSDKTTAIEQLLYMLNWQGLTMPGKAAVDVRLSQTASYAVLTTVLPQVVEAPKNFCRFPGTLNKSALIKNIPDGGSMSRFDESLQKLKIIWEIVSSGGALDTDIRQELQNYNQEFYTKELPERVWEKLAPDMKELFTAAYTRTQNEFRVPQVL